jgi:hypothetical protein
MIASEGNRNPAKLDLGAGAARRRGISPAFLSRPSVNDLPTQLRRLRLVSPRSLLRWHASLVDRHANLRSRAGTQSW